MRRSLPILFAAATAISSSALGAPAAAPPAPASQPQAVVDPAALAAANRLLDAMKYDQLIDRMMDAMIADAERNIPTRLETMAKTSLPEDLKAKLTTIISNDMRKLQTVNRPQMRQGTALIYARHFTAAEIDHMIVLMGDPVMVKMQAEIPQIMTEAIALNQANVEREMPAMLDQLKTVIENYFSKKSEKPSS
jgi:hypothetical protein